MSFQLAKRAPLFTVVDEIVVPSPEGLNLLNALGYQKVLTATCFSHIGAQDRGHPRADLLIYESDEAGFTLCVLDISSILDCSEEETTAAALVLLYSMLCSELLITYSSSQSAASPYSLLEHFVVFHHLMYYSFSGDPKTMCSVIGSGIEFVVLSSEKSLKSNEQSIVDSLIKFEDGFDEEISSRNQLREFLAEIFPCKSGKMVSIPSGDSLEVLFARDVIEKFGEKSIHFCDGFYSSGILLADYIEKFHTNLKANKDDDGYLSSALVNSWKSECVVVRMKFLCDDLSQSYIQSMEAAIPSISNFEDFEVIHKRERAQILSQFNYTVKSLVPQSIRFKKQLQACVRSKRTEMVELITGSLITRAQEVYQKYYNILDEAKRLSMSQSQQMTLVDAGSPYSNLVAFKRILENYLSTCRLELKNTGPANDKTITEVLSSELKEIIENSRYWVEGFSSLYSDGYNIRTQNVDLLKQLTAEDKALDKKKETEAAEIDRQTFESQEALTNQRIVEKREVDEKTTTCTLIDEKVKRAIILNETDKEEKQKEVLSIQTEIYENQKKSNEKRWEREKQTETLQRGIVEEERESHEWFKATIEKQRKLLENELNLEREIGTKKGSQMSIKFKSDADQLHELEKIRTDGQNELLAYKENRLKRKEKNSKDYEQLCARYNSQINELDAKLALTTAVNEAELRNKRSPSAGDHSEDDKKKCTVM